MYTPTYQELGFKRLLWRHFTWQLWVGTAIWASLLVLAGLYHYVSERYAIVHMPENEYARNQATALDYLTNETLSLLVLALFSGFIPATAGGLVRQPFLAALSKRARSASELVWKSLALFELLVCLVALIPWPAFNEALNLKSFGYQFLTTSVLSFSWLVSTGLASRRLAAALFPASSRGGQEGA